MSTAPITPRLRLRRALLRGAIVCLAIGGVVAVAALLLNQFNRFTGQVLGTLVALAFHCGVAMVLLGRMNMGRSALFAGAALAAFGAEFAILLFALWASSRLEDEALFTLTFLCAAAILARPGSRMVEQHRGPPALGWATVAAAVGGLGVFMVPVWSDWRDENLIRAAGTAAVLSFTLSQFATLYVSRAAPGPASTPLERGLFLTAVVTACVVGFALGLFIWDTDYMRAEIIVRVVGALGVIDACCTLVLIVMARLRGTPTDVAVASAVREVWLRCPRCSHEQDVAVGGSACAACGLKIDIRVEATHCATCGYALANLPSRICPECGTGF